MWNYAIQESASRDRLPMAPWSRSSRSLEWPLHLLQQGTSTGALVSGSFRGDPNLAEIIQILQTQLGGVERGYAVIWIDLIQTFIGHRAFGRPLALCEPHALYL